MAFAIIHHARLCLTRQELKNGKKIIIWKGRFRLTGKGESG
jgi:hypothetical protein